MNYQDGIAFSEIFDKAFSAPSPLANPFRDLLADIDAATGTAPTPAPTVRRRVVTKFVRS